MPVITFAYEDLKEFGINIENNKLIDVLPMLGSDIEDFDADTIKVEFFPNRPDQLSVEGVARSLKGFINQETGIPQYEVSKSGITVTVNSEIQKIRPYIGFAIIEGLSFNDDKLKKIMDFQESLHWVLGRDRKKVAIGIHDYNKISGPFKYIASKGNQNPFVPLDKENEMTPQEILDNHDKGLDYAHLLDEFERYPLILDKNDNVLSMPPIINGELTKLKNSTENIVVDVTGTDEKVVNQTLNIICSSFAEAGGKIKSLDIIYESENGDSSLNSSKTITTPNLATKFKTLNVATCCELIGITLTADEIQKLISKARMNSEILNKEQLKVEIPAYRVDILHEVDLVENVAIQYCINKIKSEIPKIDTFANESNWLKSDKIIREVMIGIGFQEIMSLMLTSEKSHYVNMNLISNSDTNDNTDNANNSNNANKNSSEWENKELKEKLAKVPCVQVAQPITTDRTIIRTSLINGLIEFLEDNKHEDLPQKIFEIGDVLYIDESQETNTKIVKKLAGAICHSKANFTEIKSIVAKLLNDLGYDFEILSSDNKSFIEGRVASIKGSSKNGTITGFFGELSPKVITNFNLEYPVVAFEIEF
ncbi:MAG: phenylalanine--tRNA ligase subunit beta [Methanobacteriaceae archaeon]